MTQPAAAYGIGAKPGATVLVGIGAGFSEKELSAMRPPQRDGGSEGFGGAPSAGMDRPGGGRGGGMGGPGGGSGGPGGPQSGQRPSAPDNPELWLKVKLADGRQGGQQ